MTKTKKLVSLLLSVLMITSVFSFANITAFAASKTGDCGANGNNVTFTYDTLSKALTISGTGAMKDYGGMDETPFDEFEIKSLTINEGITTIGNNCFGIADISATSVTFPSTLEKIGDATFSYASLKSVSFPEGIKYIGDESFSGTDISGTVSIPASVTYVGENAFAETNVTAFNVAEENMVYASQDGVLFSKDKTILVSYPSDKAGTTYAIPSTVTALENYAFSGATKLKSMTIPSTLKEISEGAFASCENLTSVTIPNSVTTINEEAFMYTALTSISIPYSVTTIDDYAFAGTNLKSVYIPNCVKTIGEAAFMAFNLKSATVPASVTSMGDMAFGMFDFDSEDMELLCRLYVYQGTYAVKYAKEQGYKYSYRTVSNLAYTNSTSTIKVSWSSVAGANGYKVYLYSAKSKSYKLYKTIANQKTTSFTMSGLKAGTAKTFKVYPYQTYGGKNYIGTYKSIATTSRVDKVTLKSLSSKKKNYISATWKINSGYTTKFQIRVSTDKNFKKNVTYRYVSGSTTSASIGKLASGKRYYVQVRAFKVVNNKNVYGSWNNTKSVKCK